MGVGVGGAEAGVILGCGFWFGGLFGEVEVGLEGVGPFYFVYVDYVGC